MVFNLLWLIRENKKTSVNNLIGGSRTLWKRGIRLGGAMTATSLRACATPLRSDTSAASSRRSGRNWRKEFIHRFIHPLNHLSDHASIRIFFLTLPYLMYHWRYIILENWLLFCWLRKCQTQVCKYLHLPYFQCYLPHTNFNDIYQVCQLLWTI